MDKIIEYYKLCSVKPKSEQLIPLVNHIQKDIVVVIFTRKHVIGYLEERDGVYHIRENVIGADEEEQNNPTPTIGGRPLIMVFD